MAELATDEHHVEPVRDQQRGIAVAQAVERQPTVAGDTGTLDTKPERPPHLTAVERPADRVREHEVVGSLAGAVQPARPQQPHDYRSHDDLPSTPFTS